MTLIINDLLKTIGVQINSGGAPLYLTKNLHQDPDKVSKIQSTTISKKNLSGEWPQNYAYSYTTTLNDYPNSTSGMIFLYGYSTGVSYLGNIYGWKKNKMIMIEGCAHTISLKLWDIYVGKINENSKVLMIHIPMNEKDKNIYVKPYEDVEFQLSGLYFTTNRTEGGTKITPITGFLIYETHIVLFGDKYIKIYKIIDNAPYIEFEKEYTDGNVVPKNPEQKNYQQWNDHTIFAPFSSNNGSEYRSIWYHFSKNEDDTLNMTSTYSIDFYSDASGTTRPRYNTYVVKTIYPNISFLKNKVHFINNWVTYMGGDYYNFIGIRREELNQLHATNYTSKTSLSLELQTSYKNIYSFTQKEIYMFLGEQNPHEGTVTFVKKLIKFTYSESISNISYDIIVENENLVVFKVPLMEVIGYTIDSGKNFTFIFPTTEFPLLAGDGTTIKVGDQEKTVNGDLQTVSSGVIEIKHAKESLTHHIYYWDGEDGGKVI